MKLIIASDIHGSFKYIKRLEKLIIDENIDKIILLGDLLYHGARNALPEEYSTMDVANTLNKYADRIIAVRGNCDSEVDDMVLNFDTRKDYCTYDFDGTMFYITHGHLFDKYPEMNDAYTLSGHTHVYITEEKHLNPGSVGIPKIHNEHTCFIYENKEFKLIDLDTYEVLSTIII